MKFFNVYDTEFLNGKYLLRTYILQHSIYHPMRKIYTQMNDDINAIIETFKFGAVYDEFIDDKHKDAITSPVDVILFLTSFTRG